MATAPEFGALPQGFVPKTTQDFLEEWTAAIRGTVDPAFDVSPTEPIGQVLGIMAAAMGSSEELIQAAYNADNPNANEGAYQDGTSGMVGVRRLAGETDAQLRVRRDLAINATTQGTGLDLMRLAVAGVPGVVSVAIKQNTGDAVDSEGRPAHSYEVIVFDGIVPQADDNAIAAAIWSEAVGGPLSFSASGDHGTVTDEAGNPQVIAFTRVTIVPIWIVATTDGQGLETSVKAAFTSSALRYMPGSTVYARQLRSLQ